METWLAISTLAVGVVAAALLADNIRLRRRVRWWETRCVRRAIDNGDLDYVANCAIQEAMMGSRPGA